MKVRYCVAKTLPKSDKQVLSDYLLKQNIKKKIVYYGRVKLYHESVRKFREIFDTELVEYFDVAVGFDVVKFNSEVAGIDGDGLSMKEVLVRDYGKEVQEFVWTLVTR